MKSSRPTRFSRTLLLLSHVVSLFALIGCKKKSSTQSSTSPVELQVKVSTPVRFIAYGDNRFHNPQDTEAANPPVRLALVRAIADPTPAFIGFTRDIVYNGHD